MPENDDTLTAPLTRSQDHITPNTPARRQRNKEREKQSKAANDRARRERDPERINSMKRDWYQRKREDIAARKRDERKRNPERINAADRARYQRAKKRKVAAVYNWRKANPDKAKAIHHARRARKHNAPGHYTAADIKAIRKQQDDHCAAPHCRATLNGNGTLDHKIPLARGGTNWPDNLQLLCGPCNYSKCDRTMEEWLAALARREVIR